LHTNGSHTERCKNEMHQRERAHVRPQAAAQGMGRRAVAGHVPIPAEKVAAPKDL
jgi:hypothetical protein